MIIVVDTTELFDDLSLRGPDWILLDDFLKREEAILVIPRIVVEEAANHFVKQLAEHLRTAERSLRILRNLLHRSDGFTMCNVDEQQAVEEYQQALTARLRELQAQQPDYQRVPVENLVNRALKGRRPFDAKGHVGFRDALIWEAVLAMVQVYSDPIILVTRNMNDFGKHGELHSDLVADLVHLGVCPERVRVSAGLHKLIEEHVKPSLKKLDDIRQSIEEQTFEDFNPLEFFDDIYSDISGEIHQQVHDWNFKELGLVTGRCFSSPALVQLHTTPSDYKVGHVYRFGSDQITFSLTYEVRGTVRCNLEPENQSDLPPPWEAFTGKATFEVECSVVLDVDCGEVEEFEVVGVEIKPSSDWPHDEHD